MTNYSRIQLIGYGSVTSQPTQVLPSASSDPYRDDAFARARTLCAVADYVRTKHRSKLGGDNTLKIFVVPEFYFRYGGPADSVERLLDSYPNGDALLADVNEKVLKPFFCREEFAHWLVVPGSMFWHRPAGASGTGKPLYFNSVLAIRGGVPAALSAAERVTNGQSCQTPTIGVSSTNQKQLMSTRDYAIGVDRSDWDAALNPMFGEVMGDWEFWRWHLFSVHGVNDRAGRPLRFGLEVCLEHIDTIDGATGLGVLRSLAGHWSDRCSAPMPDVDVHVVTSCGMDLDDEVGIASRSGGYAAICDGRQPDNWDAASWPTTDLVRVRTVRPDGARQVSRAPQAPRNVTLPDELQVGLPGGRHDPLDAIAVWEPVNYQPAGG